MKSFVSSMSAFLFCIVLISPVAVSAECAWILWLNLSFETEKDVQILQAVTGLKECQQELEKAFKQYMKNFENTPLEYKVHEKNSAKFGYFDFHNQSKGVRYVTYHLLCLPDTVDPRPR